MKKRIGALTISQSPRHDLLKPLQLAFPTAEIIEAGALDSTNIQDLSDGSNAYYPLTTTLNDGKVITLDRDDLMPLLQTALNSLEAQSTDVNVLLCAGDFPIIEGIHAPLVKPTQTAFHILTAMDIRQVAVISPIHIQNTPIQDKWYNAGFDVTVWTMPSLANTHQRAIWLQDQLALDPQIQCVVLDYVGYPAEETRQLQQVVNIPLLELGELAIASIKGMLSI